MVLGCSEAAVGDQRGSSPVSESVDQPTRMSVKALIQARDTRTDEEAVHLDGGGGYTCQRLWRGRQISEIADVMPMKPATHMKVVM